MQELNEFLIMTGKLLSVHKLCNLCHRLLPISCYGKDKTTKDGFCYACKECRNRQQKEYRQANPDIIKKIREKRKPLNKEYYNRPEIERKFKNLSLKKQFNITIEDYEKMLDLQAGVCYICKGEETSVRNRRLAVDHDHVTGKIRGLLCSNCNRALGLFKDNKELLLAAAQYLEKNNENK
jgi:hypothetical protein